MSYKTLVITGTRAEYGLLKSTIDNIQKSNILDLFLLVTGMHTQKKFGYTINDIKNDNTPISKTIPVPENCEMTKALTIEINGIYKYAKKLKPDIVVVLGDRDEAFAGAIAAGHLNIPIAHIHGGDVTGPIIDEFIRHSITKFSHLHFTSNENSKKRVILLGEEKWRVCNVGAPGLDDIKKTKLIKKIDLAKKLNISTEKKWFLFIQHPVTLENISTEKQLTPSIESLKKSDDAEIIIIYPNSDTGHEKIIKNINKLRLLSNFHIYQNFDRITYLSILNSCDVMLGNSSSGIIETGFFNLPVVNIGNRQKYRDCSGNIINVGYNKKLISKAIKKSLTKNFRTKCENIKNIYGDGNAGKKVVKIIEKNISNPLLKSKKFTYAKI